MLELAEGYLNGPVVSNPREQGRPTVTGDLLFIGDTNTVD